MLPLLFSKSKKSNPPGTVLTADVGATKTNLALYKMNGELSVLKEATYRSCGYGSLTEITADFFKGLAMPHAICIAAAGLVTDRKAKLTNLLWEINCTDIEQQTGVADVFLINDLEATAYGLAMLTDQDAHVIHKGSSNLGNVAVIAPGTGLGEAGLYFDGTGYHPFATEGGHADFASRDSLDFELYEYLQQQFGHVSYERLVSGPGIENIYRFFKDVKKREAPCFPASGPGDLAAMISRKVEQNTLCRETIQLFMRILAHESANLALKLKATGGLFIAGGIAPQLIHLFERYEFNKHFVSSGRLNDFLETIPVTIISNTKTPLLGAAYYAAAGIA